MLETLAPEVFAELGAEFIERTRIHRKLDRPFFVDKLPNNFLQLGLIQLILPNAKIIDARRHPIACCFSIFKQNFARGAQYSYSLADLGRYYTDYLTLMAHFDALAPGGCTGCSMRSWCAIRRPRSAGCSTIAASTSNRRA